MAHPRTALLAAFKTALSGLPSVVTVLDQAAKPVAVESLPSITIVPGEETIESMVHVAAGQTLITHRKLRVRVVCHAKTRELADQIAAEVEAYVPYDSGLGTVLAGSEFGEDADGESLVFSVRVNFDVLYEAATGTA